MQMACSTKVAQPAWCCLAPEWQDRVPPLAQAHAQGLPEPSEHACSRQLDSHHRSSVKLAVIGQTAAQAHQEVRLWLEVSIENGYVLVLGQQLQTLPAGATSLSASRAAAIDLVLHAAQPDLCLPVLSWGHRLLAPADMVDVGQVSTAGAENSSLCVMRSSWAEACWCRPDSPGDNASLVRAVTS